MLNVDQIEQRLSLFLEGNSVISNIDPTDYANRLVFINQANEDWAEAANWKVLTREFNMNVSTATGNASIVLPSNFRKLASFPKISNTNSSTDIYPETSLIPNANYENTDKRVMILGNPSEGYFMRVLGVTLISGASVKVPYYSTVSSLASPANIPECPNPQFIVKRATAYALEDIEDGRYIAKRAESDLLLANLIDKENVFSIASDEGTAKTNEELYGGQRMGGW